MGFTLADEVRELAIAFRKVGITASQCALGFRIGATMLKIGVKQDVKEVI